MGSRTGVVEKIPHMPVSKPREIEVRRGRRTVRLTRLDQLWWPEEGIRKADVVDYYRRVSPVLIPHLRGRPLTLRRHYQGPRSPYEWLKDAPPEAPDWLRVAALPASSRGGGLVRYPLADDELSLLWLIEFGCVDLHAWAARADRPDRPDVVVFDLDPAGVPFADVTRAASLLREALAGLGLESYANTTGGDGLHVRVPVMRRHSFAEAREFAAIVTVALRRTAPRLVTTERSRERRRGVFVDTKMVGRGQQLVVPYSVRPKAEAPVATPLRWEEVTEALKPRAFTMATVLERITREGDVAAPLLHSRQRLDRALRAVR
jgi:bifunctional non-homologous end joining protein LigD